MVRRRIDRPAECCLGGPGSNKQCFVEGRSLAGRTSSSVDSLVVAVVCTVLDKLYDNTIGWPPT